MLLLTLLTARADVAPEPPAGKVFVRHYLEITNLSDHPDAILLAFDPPGAEGKIIGHRVFSATRDARQLLSNGASARGSRFSQPKIVRMEEADYEAWSAASSAEIAQQEELCEQGIGCAHISRFVPRYTAPTAIIDCGASFPIVTSTITGGETERVESLTLTDASAGKCALSGLSPSPPAAEPAAEPAASPGCTAAPAAAPWAAGLFLLLCRRRDASRPGERG